MAAARMTMPSGEPRFTKVPGEQRYYDHVAGHSISKRQYYKLKGQPQEAPSWSAEKAAALKTPPAVRAVPRQEESGGPSLLAQQLLHDSMLGSPVVETPPAPRVDPRQLATSIAEETKNSVRSLAEAVSPALAMLLTAACTLILPPHLSWIGPEQEEAELILEPAARLVIRNVGLSGKELGDNGRDILALVAAMTAYLIGIKTRLDEYLDEYQEEENEQRAPDIQPGRRGDGGARSEAPAYTRGAGSSPLARVSREDSEQARPRVNQQARPADVGPGGRLGTQNASQQAASIAALFDADYEGRKRLGLAR